MLDVYMSEKYIHHWPAIVQFAADGDKEQLRRYAMEGCRLSRQCFAPSRSVTQDISIEERGTIYNLKPGDKVSVNLVCP
jgi:hypothetical protein